MVIFAYTSREGFLKLNTAIKDTDQKGQISSDYLQDFSNFRNFRKFLVNSLFSRCPEGHEIAEQQHRWLFDDLLAR